jgi:hypothetical protein
MHRTPPVFRDGDLEHRVRSQPTNGPQVPRQRAKIYCVAAGLRITR